MQPTRSEPYRTVPSRAEPYRTMQWKSANRFHSPPYPFFSSLLASAVSSHLSIEETPSARLSKLENYGFDQLVSQRDWHHLLNEKSGFWGTCLSWRDVRGRIYEGCVGEVANRVSGGSFRWGRWGYLPFRHHDNRYSAVWIRLYPGLSKNSEDGNSCPKSHKAARFDWSCGKSGQQWDWDYKPEYGYHHDETRSFGSETFRDQNGQREWAALCSCSPQSHNNLILSFLAPRTGALAKAVWITTLRERWSGNLFLPPPTTDITPLPHSTASVKRFAPPLGRAGLLTGAEINGTGPDGCLPELDMFPLLQVMCLWYMCFCAEVFFFCSQTVLQMEHSLGVKNFFPPLSPHVKAVFF